MIPFHPLADLFPLIEGVEFEALVADVAAQGLRQKILLREGKILDGRNRYRALVQAGLVGGALGARAAAEKHPKFFTSCDDISDAAAARRVVSLNVARRHLTESQRALIAARLAGMGRGRPQKAQPEKSANLQNIGAVAGDPSDLPAGDSGRGAPALAVAEAAGLLNVSSRSVASARKLIEAAPAAVVAEVAAGGVAVSAALTRLDKARAVFPAAAEASAPPDDAALLARYREIAAAERARKAQAKKDKRAEKERALGERLAGSNADLAAIGAAKKYGVILADPEWKYEVWSGKGYDRAAENHYPTSGTAAICARPVAEIAAKDCVLFLWATAPMLPDALEVLKAWGFDYATHYVWRKHYAGERQGLGWWARINHELLLIGTRGKPPCPAPGTQWGSVIDAPVGAHSEKPGCVHEMIEAYFPTAPKIELNARAAREGWDCWGAESPRADEHRPERADKQEPSGMEQREAPQADEPAEQGSAAGGGAAVIHISTEAER